MAQTSSDSGAMKQAVLGLLVVVMYALHQDVWFWRTAQPVVWGILPVGLFYHAMYAALVVLLMALLVKYAWPEKGTES